MSDAMKGCYERARRLMEGVTAEVEDDKKKVVDTTRLLYYIESHWWFFPPEAKRDFALVFWEGNWSFAAFLAYIDGSGDVRKSKPKTFDQCKSQYDTNPWYKNLDVDGQIRDFIKRVGNAEKGPRRPIGFGNCGISLVYFISNPPSPVGFMCVPLIFPDLGEYNAYPRAFVKKIQIR